MTAGVQLGLSWGKSGWLWADGTSYDYSNFETSTTTRKMEQKSCHTATTDPLNGECVYMLANGKWRNDDCGLGHSYICGRQQGCQHSLGRGVRSEACRVGAVVVLPVADELRPGGDHFYSPSYPRRVESGSCDYYVSASDTSKKVGCFF